MPFVLAKVGNGLFRYILSSSTTVNVGDTPQDAFARKAGYLAFTGAGKVILDPRPPPIV